MGSEVVKKKEEVVVKEVTPGRGAAQQQEAVAPCKQSQQRSHKKRPQQAEKEKSQPIHVDPRTAPGADMYMQFLCSYCGELRISTLAACVRGDRIRIRCECGGKHRDHKLRMHACWAQVPDRTFRKRS